MGDVAHRPAPGGGTNMRTVFGVKSITETSREAVALLFERHSPERGCRGSQHTLGRPGKEFPRSISCVAASWGTGLKLSCHRGVTLGGNDLLHLLNGKMIVLVPKALANTLSCFLSQPPRLPKNIVASKGTGSYKLNKKGNQGRHHLSIVLPGSLLTNDNR